MVKLIQLIAIILCLDSELLAKTEFQSIDQHALTVADSATKNIETLVTYLTDKANSEQEIIRAFYVWITNNIEYDYRSVEINRIKNISAEKVFDKRIAVCSGYSKLFKAMCDKVSIQSDIINGYTREYNFKAEYPFCWSEHAWNSVYINNQWQLIDVTWGRNKVSRQGLFHNNTYFLIDPKIMIFDHLPENKMWQLLNCPISIDDFKKNKESIETIMNNCDSCYDYNTDIYQYQNVNNEHAVFWASVDAYKFNPENSFSVGLGHMNFGLYLSKLNSRRYQKHLTKKEKIRNQKDAIAHLNFSRKLLKESKYKNSEKYYKSSKRNLKKLKQKLKAIKRR